MNNLKVNVTDYISKEELKSIVAEEFRMAVNHKLSNIEVNTFITNMAYHLIWEEVEKSLPEDYKEQLGEKVQQIFNELSSYSVFRKKDAFTKESIAQTALNQAIEDNLPIINDVVSKIFKSDSLHDEVIENIRESMFDRDINITLK